MATLTVVDARPAHARPPLRGTTASADSFKKYIRRTKHLAMVAAAAAASVTFAATAGAQVFNNGIPSGYTCDGVCGTSGANGSIPLAPGGGSQFGYVTTAGSNNTANPLNVDLSTNGSQLTSSTFTATAGQTLSFGFDYITADGNGEGTNWADYGYARLLGSGGAPDITLFTARTTPPPGNAVPGFDLPGIASGVSLNPASVVIHDGTEFTGLGSGDDGSGECFGDIGNGCGNSGWVFASFLFQDAGTYQLQVGVNNWQDENYQTALALDFANGEGGVPTSGGGVTTTPEPSSLALLGTGLFGLVPLMRRKKLG